MNVENQENMSSASSMDEKSALEKGQRSTTEEDPTTDHTSNSSGDAPPPLEKVATDLPHALSKIASVAASSDLQRVDTRPDGSDYPSGLKLGLITLALCLGVFLMALDNSIIATAIPHITDQFNSLDDVGCTALIIGRAIAGAGAAGIMSGALLILALTVPLRKRPAYGGMLASMYGISSVAGPLLGGVFTDKATWRWCFYINLPIGAITLLVIIFFFEAPAERAATTSSDDNSPSETPAARQDKTWREILNEFDPIGTAVFMPAIICLLLALQWGGTAYAWNSWRIILCFVLFGLLLLSFLYIQHRQGDNATIPPRVIAMRPVWAGAFFAFAAGASFFVAIYFLPIWFQAVKGASAVQSGIDNLPMLIAVVIMSIVAGAAVSIFGYYTPWMLLSTVLLAVGYGLASTLKPDSGEGLWIGYQIIAGAGMGFGMQQPLMAMQAVLSNKDLPTGTAIIVFMQTIGGSLFVSVGQNVFNNKLVSYTLEYAPGMDPQIVLSTGATTIQKVIKEQFPQYLTGVTLAYSDALTQTFVVSAAMAAISIIGSGLMPWGSVKGKQVEVGMA
ncbi:hypothetical protein N0V82_004404 [Gnomoniopsis sp. IMI 355080]|nr:hypothetical protein N0V82_004404 [Gnomoniopsis sp. IMI 355080]